MRALFFLLLIITSLSNVAASIDVDVKKQSKETFIRLAENRDIDAMLGLYLYYDFPNTPEGLSYFKKWYALIDESVDTEKLLQITQVYHQHKERFINPDEKLGKLYQISFDKKNGAAVIAYLKGISDDYPKDQNPEILQKNVRLLSKQQMDELSEEIITKSLTDYAEILEEEYKRRGLEPHAAIFIVNYLKVYRDPELRKKVVESVLETKNVSLITAFARYIYNTKNEHDTGMALTEKAYQLDNSDQETLLRLANMYFNKERIDEAHALYLRNIELHQDVPSASKMLRYYSTQKDTLAEYKQMVEVLKTNSEGRYILAKYLYDLGLIKRANQLLQPLAKQGDKEARYLLLISNASNKLRYNAESGLVYNYWMKDVLEDENVHNIRSFFQRVRKSTFSKYFKQELKDWAKQNIENNKLDALTDAVTNLYRYDIDTFRQAEKAVLKNEDVGASLHLAKVLISSASDEVKDEEKGLALYQQLVDKGELRAVNKLADHYIGTSSPSPSDIAKGLHYLEMASDLGDMDATEKCARIFLCLECEQPDSFYYEELKKYADYRDYDKGLKYTLRLDPAYSADASLNLGYLYEHGKAVDQDYKRAIEYYKKGLNSRLGGVALYRLGYLAEFGLGMTKNSQKAFYYYKDAVQVSRNKKAVYRLALMYENGGEGVEKNLSEALYYFKQLRKTEDVKRVEEKVSVYEKETLN